jgi:HEPN domain-containing protein
MMPPDAEIKEAARHWLEKADKDLRAGRLVLDHDVSLGGVAAFHAQQAAEKYLKALLTWRQIAFTKTHDLGLLLELLGRDDPSLVGNLRAVIELTDFAVDARYPGDIPDISNHEACPLLELALLARKEILTRLPEDFNS